MTFITELTPDRAIDVVFGDTAQVLDWQMDIASVVPLVTLNMDTSQVVRFQAQRLYRLRQNAMKAVDLVTSLAAKKPIGFLKEVDVFRKGMTAFEESERIAFSSNSSGLSTDGERSIREALWDVLEEDATELDRMRSALRAEIQSDLDRLDKLKRQQLDQAGRQLVDGLLEEILERARILREARRLYHEVISEAGADVSCAVWVNYCWLTWQLTANEDDTMIPVEFAAHLASTGAGAGKALCTRLYAYLLTRFDRYDEAYQAACTAVAIWPSVGALHERARYAVMAGRGDVVVQELEALVQSGALGTLLAFADPTFTVLHSELLDYAIREQMRMRQIARQEIAEWDIVARKAVEVRRRVPALSLPHDLMDGASTARELNDHASFLVAAQQIRRASSAKEDLKCLTVAALNAEKRRQAEMIDVARRNIDGALEARDSWIKASFEAHEQELGVVRSTLAKSETKGDVAQRGCGMGLASGCGLLVAYILFAFVLSTRGLMIGPRTPIGAGLLVLSSLPIIVSLLYHMAYSAKRMMLEGQVHSQVAHSTEQYDRARKEANEQFRGRIEASQQKLLDEEAQLVQVEEALRIFP